MEIWMNYKIKSIALLLLTSMLFQGCAVTQLITIENPLDPTFKTTGLVEKYDSNLSISINKKSDKIFIDNRFDTFRTQKIIDIKYNQLLDDDIEFINYDDSRFITTDKTQKVEEIFMEYVKLDLDYTFLASYAWFFDNSERKYDYKMNIKKVKDGIKVYPFKNSKDILLAYSYASLNLGYGISPTPFKLDIKAMDNGVAHFTDEYLKKYSLKEPLEKELKNQGYTIVDNIKEADIVIVTENIGFGNFNKLASFLPYPKSENITYSDLRKGVDIDKFYNQRPKHLLDFRDLLTYTQNSTQSKQNNTVPNIPGNLGTAGGAAVALALMGSLPPHGGPLTMIDTISVFRKTNKIGKIINLTIAQPNRNKNFNTYDYDGKIKEFQYEKVLSDELIDELNTQAAKQVLDKIRFVDK
jgi:hypothetical protein